MTTLIYDAVDVPAIPLTAKIVLAYIDGVYVTLAAVQKRFPNNVILKPGDPMPTDPNVVVILTVTTNGKNRAFICDVESQDATPAIAGAGVKAGLYPAVYSDVSNEEAVFAACGSHPFSWFAANPTGKQHLVPRSVATQYMWPGHGSPGNYDVSVTNGVFPFAAITPTKEDAMSMCATDPKTGGTWSTDADGAMYNEFGAPDPGSLTAHPSWDAGESESGGKAPCVGIAACIDKVGEWGVVYFVQMAGRAPDGSLYHTYRFNRDGTTDGTPKNLSA